LHGERPPLAALAGVHDPELARSIGKSVDEVGKKSSMGMLLWAKMSSKVSRAWPSLLVVKSLMFYVLGRRRTLWGR
jgi:hypothetical protein